MFKRYTYTILRYRHDAVSGEQLNIGVVLWAPDDRFLGAIINKNYGRIRKAFPQLEGSILKADLIRFQKAFDQLKLRLSNELLLEDVNASILAQKVIGLDSTSLIWSEIGSGICKDSDVEVNHLYKRFVLENEFNTDAKRVDADIWKPFKDKLIERDVTKPFEEKIIETELNSVKFEHSYKNGKWHCIQPLSFDLSSETSIQDKAARWTGHMLGLSNSNENFQTYFILGRPQDLNLVASFEKARKLLSSAPKQPKIVMEDNLDHFADEIARIIE